MVAYRDRVDCSTGVWTFVFAKVGKNVAVMGSDFPIKT